MAALTGRILDSAGRPVAGASIFLVAAPVAMPDIAQLSSADGGFDLEAPSPGRYTIGAMAPGRGQGRITIDVGEGDAAPVEIRIPG